MRKVQVILFCLAVCLGMFAQTDTERRYELLFHEAMLERQKGHHDATFDLLTRCLELRPNASETCFFLAQYYAQMKQTDKAVELFKRAADLSPDNITYMETLGRSYIGKEQYADAIPVFEKMYERQGTVCRRYSRVREDVRTGQES